MTYETGPGHGSRTDERRRGKRPELTPTESPDVPTAVTEAEGLRRALRVYQSEIEARDEELRRAHVALEAARARYHDLYSGAPVALITVGFQGTILRSNERAADLLGLRSPTRRWRITDFLLGDAGEAFERQHAHLLKGGDPETVEVELKGAGGSVRWAEMVMNLTREETDGSLVCQIALTDITELKRMRDGVARLAAIVTSAQQAILSEDVNGVIASWNSGAERLFGYSSTEAIGHHIDMLIPPARRAEERAISLRVRTRAAYAHETVRQRRDGTLVPVFVAAAPIVDPDGRVSGVSYIVQDVTTQVQARQEVQRLLGDLREADRRKDTFIATLAHELRNPLAPIRNAAAVLSFTPDLDPKLQWCRDVIDRQVKHMSVLLEDLLDVSRLTRNAITMRRDRVELATAIVQAVETTRPMIEGRRHKLALDMPTEPIEVEGDLNRLIQIFGNLLSNASKYMAPGGDIRVVVERRGDEVVVRVRDRGIGISPTQLGRVFEMFSQVDPGAEVSAGGLGIGLALVKGLVERHHGKVVATSEGIGRGSEFIVTLPLAVSRPPLAAESTPVVRYARPGVARSRRVLVVDDNEDAAESMAIVLGLAGHEVRTAHDGEHALEIAREYHPHLMFLDLGMPRVNGYDVARRIRGESGGDDIVLVACTGWGQPEDRRRAKDAGFDHHLVKPVSPEAALQLVAAVSKRA
jgi:two-component system CheB/CheR fusion protein